MKEKNTCWECNKRMKEKKVEYTLYGEVVGKFPALVCEKCNETFFSEETSKKITEKTKEKGLWGLNYKTKIGQAGSTLDIRLNKKIIEFLGLRKGEEVSVQPEGKNKIVITI